MNSIYEQTFKQNLEFLNSLSPEQLISLHRKIKDKSVRGISANSIDDINSLRCIDFIDNKSVKMEYVETIQPSLSNVNSLFQTEIYCEVA